MQARRTVPTAEFSWYDGEKLPFPDESFDVVVGICVLHHVPVSKRFNMVSEMVRVTRPEGFVAVFEHNPFNPLTRHAVNSCALDQGVVLLPSTQAVESAQGRRPRGARSAPLSLLPAGRRHRLLARPPPPARPPGRPVRHLGAKGRRRLDETLRTTFSRTRPSSTRARSCPRPRRPSSRTNDANTSSAPSGTARTSVRRSASRTIDTSKKAQHRFSRWARSDRRREGGIGPAQLQTHGGVIGLHRDDRRGHEARAIPRARSRNDAASRLQAIGSSPQPPAVTGCSGSLPPACPG